ncbi:MAG: ATP synthase F0 subunit C [Leptospiraceae bacterium]|nr:ATP synthase F0 subunit C [Leptospiraceae bacterium]MCB1317204.1 ATP synthase F0 subunit C [Leptospiraceae bacterium]MCB1319274.1 ATP synthase F0 subunit C [Leptospiraceae bacterium]
MIALAFVGVGVGAGLVIFGAAVGIGRIGGQAVEGMSRQPEAAGKIQTAMIIAAALIEGVTLFALVIVLLLGLEVNGDLIGKFAPQAPQAVQQNVQE